jgi:spermidine synthase
MHILTTDSSAYNRITIYESTQLDGKLGRFRCMKFADEAIQGAIDLKDRDRIVLEYQKVLIYLMELTNPAFDHVFLIGHGIGTIATHFSRKRMVVAEIDEKVVALSRQYFDADTEHVVIGDGREVLEMQKSNSLDFVILDAFDHKGTPQHLLSLSFFRMARTKLVSQGILILNVLGKPKNDRLINAIHATIREAFEYCRAFSLPAEEAEQRNMIVMASRYPIDLSSRVLTGCYEVELGLGHIIGDSDPLNDRTLP